MTTEFNATIQDQIRENVLWKRRAEITTSVAHPRSSYVYVLTHREVTPSGQTFIQAVAISEWCYNTMKHFTHPRVEAVSGWHLTGEAALLALLAKTEEEVGRLFKLKICPYNTYLSATDGFGETLYSALGFDELPTEIQPPSESSLPQDESEEVQESGSRPPTPSIPVNNPPDGASDVLTTGPPTIAAEALPVTASEDHGDGDMVTLRIPASEIATLARKAAREVFADDGTKVATLAVQRQLSGMFGVLANLGSFENQGGSIRLPET